MRIWKIPQIKGIVLLFWINKYFSRHFIPSSKGNLHDKVESVLMKKRLLYIDFYVFEYS